MEDARRALPRTDVLLNDPRLSSAADRVGRETVKKAIAAALSEARSGALAVTEIADRAYGLLPQHASGLRSVLNATGVVLHTNLGRAALSEAAVEAVAVAAGYVDVEFDLVDGARSTRGRGALSALAEAVPSAPRVLAVNNGAAALLLAVSTLAAGREVIVSRGEMVEIGDGFRLPDLMVCTGARIREVGTTNRTTLRDYASAIGPETGCIVKIHPSNFQLTGFTSSVDVRALSTLTVPVVADIGSGLLTPDRLLPEEPDVTTSLAAGADVVTCSADKLLGGPQAGLIFGDAELLSVMRRHPLARAVRCDKLTLATLEASVRGPQTPTWAALHADPDALRARCERIADALGAVVVPSDGAVGGGGAPGVALPGWAVSLPAKLAGPLRVGRPPVVGRVNGGHLLIDLRCIPLADDDRVIAAVRHACREAG